MIQALKMQNPSVVSDKFFPSLKCLIGEGFGQPLQRIYLDTVDPHFKMKVRPGDTSGGADLSDQLPGLDVVPDGNQEF